MNNYYSIDDLLDQWVKNEITFEELSLRTEKNDLLELSQNMEMHMLATHAIQRYATLSELSPIHEKYLHKRRLKTQMSAPIINIKRKNRVAIKIASVAAVFAVLLVAMQVLFVSSSRIYSDAFIEYFGNNERAYTAVPVTENISKMFQNKQYKEVLVAAKVNSKEYGNKELFFAGYSALVLKDYKAAETYFSTLLNRAVVEKNTLFLDEAEYYLSLTKLQLGKIEEAYYLMKRIYNSPEHTYHAAFDYWTMLRMRWMK